MTQGAGSNSSTRAIIAGGETPTRVNTIHYFTMMTLGDTADFGDLTRVASGCFGAGNAVRSLIA